MYNHLFLEYGMPEELLRIYFIHFGNCKSLFQAKIDQLAGSKTISPVTSL